MNNRYNKVTTRFTAVIDGKATGLAGCTTGCLGCLRADPKLDRSIKHGEDPATCAYLTPLQSTAWEPTKETPA